MPFNQEGSKMNRLWEPDPEMVRREAANFNSGLGRLKAMEHDRKVLPPLEVVSTTDKPSIPEQDTTPVPPTEDEAEKDWVERYMKSTGCERETATMVYRDILSRDHEDKDK